MFLLLRVRAVYLGSPHITLLLSTPWLATVTFTAFVQAQLREGRLTGLEY